MSPVRPIIAAALLMGLASHAMAQQSLGERGFRPIEPIVGDVDPLRQSLRQLQSGLSPYGQDAGSAVYRRVLPGGGQDNRVFYIQPGMTAQFDRSEYVTFEIKDQPFTAQMIPPNTVFHLGVPPAPTPPVLPDNPLLVKAQIDRRVDAQPIVAPESSEAASDTTPSFLRFRETQRRSVLDSIDRALRQPDTQTHEGATPR